MTSQSEATSSRKATSSQKAIETMKLAVSRGLNPNLVFEKRIRYTTLNSQGKHCGLCVGSFSILKDQAGGERKDSFYWI